VKRKQKSIVFRSGREQFLWRVARSSPIVTRSQRVEADAIKALAKRIDRADLPTVRVKWAKEDARILKREVYLGVDRGMSLADTVFPVDVKRRWPSHHRIPVGSQ